MPPNLKTYNQKTTPRSWPKNNYLVIIILRAEKSHQERSSLSGGGILVEHAGLNDLLIHIQLVSGGSQDLLLHAVDSHQSQDSHFILLTDTMSAVLGLQILVKQNKQSVTEGDQCLKSQVWKESDKFKDLIG